MPVRLEKWQPGWGELSETNMKKRLEGEGYAVSQYTYPPGASFPEHTHAVDKKDTVLQGRLRITSEGKEFVLEAGDMIEIPAETPHTADVVGGEAVVSFDATKSPQKK